MHKALQQRHLKLPQVVTDLPGVPGMASIKAILAGERDGLPLAKLRNPRCKPPEDDLATALAGTGRDEHLLAWQQAVALYEFYRQQLLQCEQHIEAPLQTCADQSAGPP